MEQVSTQVSNLFLAAGRGETSGALKLTPVWNVQKVAQIDLRHGQIRLDGVSSTELACCAVRSPPFALLLVASLSAHAVRSDAAAHTRPVCPCALPFDLCVL